MSIFKSLEDNIVYSIYPYLANLPLTSLDGMFNSFVVPSKSTLPENNLADLKLDSLASDIGTSK